MKVRQENDSMSLVLQISLKFMGDLKETRILAPKGDPIDIWGQGSFTFGNFYQMECRLETKSTPDVLALEIDFWEELETLDISFEIETVEGFQSLTALPDMAVGRSKPVCVRSDPGASLTNCTRT